MMKNCCLFFIFIISLSVFPSAADTISVKKDTTSGFEKTKFVFALDFRNSFVRNSPVSIYGIQAGLKFKNRHLLTLGGYTVTRRGKANFKNNNKNKSAPGQPPPPPNMVLNTELELYFVSFGYAYSIINRKKIELSMPVEIGLGASTLTTYYLDGKLFGPPVKSIFTPVQAGLKLEWRFSRWLGVIGSVGYRKTFETDVRQDYDGLYYHVGAGIYIGNIIRDYKSWRHKKTQKK